MKNHVRLDPHTGKPVIWSQDTRDWLARSLRNRRRVDGAAFVRKTWVLSNWLTLLKISEAAGTKGLWRPRPLQTDEAKK